MVVKLLFSAEETFVSYIETLRSAVTSYIKEI